MFIAAKIAICVCVTNTLYVKFIKSAHVEKTRHEINHDGHPKKTT